MKKAMNMIAPIVSLGCLAATSYLIMESKKNMLDVIIEEIETMK